MAPAVRPQDGRPGGLAQAHPEAPPGGSGALEPGDRQRPGAAAVDADHLERGFAVAIRGEDELLAVGRPRRVLLVPDFVAGQPEGKPPVRRQQEEVVAAPDVRREGDEAPVRGYRGAGPEGGLLDVEFLVVALPLDAEDAPGPRVVRAVGDGHQEPSGQSRPEVRAGIGLDLVGIPAPDQRVRSVGADHPDVEAAGLGRRVDDGPAAGGPRVEVHRGMTGETLGRASGAVHPPDVEVAVRVPGEDHRSAVRGPVGLEVVGRLPILRPAGQLAGFAARPRHHPEAAVQRERDLGPVGGPGGIRRPRRDPRHQVVLDPNLSAGDRRVAQGAHLGLGGKRREERHQREGGYAG